MLSVKAQISVMAFCNCDRSRTIGPILWTSKGDLRTEVKRVVWHEVAHWLGYETEEQVQALGL